MYIVITSVIVSTVRTSANNGAAKHIHVSFEFLLAISCPWYDTALRVICKVLSK